MILTIMGTRPQYVKCAILRSAYEDAGIKEILLDTGQHYDSNMSTEIFQQLNVAEPDIKLALGGQSQCTTIGIMIIELERIVKSLMPTAIVVLGDTNSTLAGALIAKRLGMQLFHIEAGLRSFDKTMPEEQNRIMTDHLSDQLFCPTRRAIENLENEGIVRSCYLTGDVMLDAVLTYKRAFKPPESISPAVLKQDFDLVTLHRAEALLSKNALEARLSFIKESSLSPTRIFMLHPHTERKLREFGISTDGFLLIGPQGYLETQWLLSNANHLYTDSGGLQKEAFFHKCQTTTIRSTTEWPETCLGGTNRLWTGEEVKDQNNDHGNSFGTGHAGSKIAALVKAAL